MSASPPVAARSPSPLRQAGQPDRLYAFMHDQFMPCALCLILYAFGRSTRLTLRTPRVISAWRMPCAAHPDASLSLCLPTLLAVREPTVLARIVHYTFIILSSYFHHTFIILSLYFHYARIVHKSIIRYKSIICPHLPSANTPLRPSAPLKV